MVSFCASLKFTKIIFPAHYEESSITRESRDCSLPMSDSLPSDFLLAQQLTFADLEHKKSKQTNTKEIFPFWSGFIVAKGEKGRDKQWFAPSHGKETWVVTMATRQKLQKWLATYKRQGNSISLTHTKKKLTMGKSTETFPRKSPICRRQ